MTCFAPLVILTTVALHAGSRIDLAVDLVLVQVVSPVRESTLGRILELVAGLDVLLVRMAIRAERFDMTYIAGLFVLLRHELMPKFAELSGMVHR